MTAETDFVASTCALHRAELVRTLSQRYPRPGTYETAITPLHVLRLDAPSDWVHTLHKPALCLILQGHKTVTMGEDEYRYDPLHYLVVSVTLPMAGRVVQASPEAPYLCLRLDFEPSDLAQVIADAPPAGLPDAPERGVFTDPIDAPLLDTMLRLVRLLDTPKDIGMLAPLALRELYYRLLRGAHGRRLYALAMGDTQSRRVHTAIDWLNRHYAEPLRIEALARLANLGSSTLHQHFKAVTSMSPLQYQKQLRLQEARRLMLCEGLDVSSACYRVGYESPSQFSREYSRQFGSAPSRDIEQMRQRGVGGAG